MVRLKVDDGFGYVHTLYGFNSTMVRLKDMKRKITDEQARLFQFHYGSIKSAVVEPISNSPISFNSTMVRLKGYAKEIGYMGDTGFNSTMVRLKVNYF